MAGAKAGARGLSSLDVYTCQPLIVITPTDWAEREEGGLLPAVRVGAALLRVTHSMAPESVHSRAGLISSF